MRSAGACRNNNVESGADMNTIQVQWQSYLRDVVPAGASKEQIVETKRAFYMGSAATISFIFSDELQALSEEGRAAVIEGVHEELRHYVAGVGFGYE